MSQDTITVIAIIGVILVVAGIALSIYVRKKRTLELQARFGSEYDKAIIEHGDRRHAESELENRTERVAKFKIHPLPAADRLRYADDWRRGQSLFVDDPRN